MVESPAPMATGAVVWSGFVEKVSTGLNRVAGPSSEAGQLLMALPPICPGLVQRAAHDGRHRDPMGC
jgi:hypothetical protein